MFGPSVPPTRYFGGRPRNFRQGGIIGKEVRDGGPRSALIVFRMGFQNNGYLRVTKGGNVLSNNNISNVRACKRISLFMYTLH